MPGLAAVDDDVGALVDAGADVRLDAVALGGGDDRADDRVLRRAGRPPSASPAIAASAVDQLVVRLRCTIARVGAVQIWPLWNAHTLPMAVTASVEVGVVEHHRRALAAELEQQALHRVAAGLVDGLARPTVEPVNDTMSMSRVSVSAAAGSGAADVTTLTTPGREPDVAHDLGEHEDRERVLRRGLHHDGAADRERGRDLARRCW